MILSKSFKEGRGLDIYVILQIKGHKSGDLRGMESLGT